MNCTRFSEEAPKIENIPQLSSKDIFLLESSGFAVHKEKPSLPTAKIQHNGLRCRKCFELLVHDDEFLYYRFLLISSRYAGGRLLVNPQILLKREWKGLHYSGDVVLFQTILYS